MLCLRQRSVAGRTMGTSFHLVRVRTRVCHKVRYLDIFLRIIQLKEFHQTLADHVYKTEDELSRFCSLGV